MRLRVEGYWVIGLLGCGHSTCHLEWSDSVVRDPLPFQD